MAAAQRLYDGGDVAALRQRFRIAVAHKLDAVGVDLAAMTKDERFAAVSDAVKKIDVEMLAELVCIDLDIGPCRRRLRYGCALGQGHFPVQPQHLREQSHKEKWRRISSKHSV